jgi:hypothetical protein
MVDDPAYLQKSAKRLGKPQESIVQEFEKECGGGSRQRPASWRSALTRPGITNFSISFVN